MKSRKQIRPKSHRELRLEALKNEISSLSQPPDLVKKDFQIKLHDYEESLVKNEYSPKTIEVYLRVAKHFIENYTNDDNPLRKEKVLLFKDDLLTKYESVQTINTYITSAGKFLHFCGQGEYTVKKIKGHTSNVLDHRIYTREYNRMLKKAKNIGEIELYYVMKVMAGTGIRVNELKSFTTDSITKDHIKVNNKGRIRLVPIPGPLVRQLRKYAKDHKIDGALFSLSYDQIYRGLKSLASTCKVKKSKVHPHAFRHYFGFHFISTHSQNKITELSDILGHTSIETTRIYTRGTLADVKKSMEDM